MKRTAIQQINFTKQPYLYRYEEYHADIKITPTGVNVYVSEKMSNSPIIQIGDTIFDLSNTSPTIGIAHKKKTMKKLYELYKQAPDIDDGVDPNFSSSSVKESETMYYLLFTIYNNIGNGNFAPRGLLNLDQSTKILRNGLSGEFLESLAPGIPEMEKLFDKFINRIFGHYCMKRLKCRSLHNESVYRIISCLLYTSPSPRD